jgi:biopolymer transport protein ExbD
MAFVLARRLQPMRGLIDLAPVVTVVLLLLLFFLLSSSFVLQPGVKVEPPRSTFGVGTPLSRLIVAVMMPPPQVDANGVALKRDPILYFDDQVVTADGLRAALDRLPASPTRPSLVIKADKEVPLDVIMNIVDIASAHHLTAIIGTQPETGAAAPAR